MFQYVVVPTRRVTAQAINLMFAHAIGEAGSPYIVGLVTDSFKAQYPIPGTNSTRDDTSPMSVPERDFLSLQKGCYVTVVLEFCAALLFLVAALTISKDWKKAQKEEEGKLKWATSTL